MNNFVVSSTPSYCENFLSATDAISLVYIAFVASKNGFKSELKKDLRFEGVQGSLKASVYQGAIFLGETEISLSMCISPDHKLKCCQCVYQHIIFQQY